MERRACRALLLGLLLAATAFPPWVVSRAAARTLGERAQQAKTCVFDHMNLRTAPHKCRPRAKAYPASVATAAERAIYDSSLTFGVPYSILLSIGRCESDLNPHASNGKRFGLFQFAPATFRRAAASLRAESGIVAHSYWNALDASYAAGFLFATGRSTSWTCETARG